MTIEDIFNENWPGFMNYSEIKRNKDLLSTKNISAGTFMISLKQAYNLGLGKLEKSNEINYHISPNQTNLFEDGME